MELEVEKELGLDGKEQIEQYGLAPFIEKFNFPVHVFSLSLITSNADCFAIFPINI